MYYIVVRESQPEDAPYIAELVRRAYSTNVNRAWFSVLFNEVTFQSIVIVAAFMFIFMGVPVLFCLLSIPIVLLMTYVLIYGAILMKSAEINYSKRALKSWVAESYEPYFFNEKPENVLYKIVTEDDVRDEGLMDVNFRKKIIGTCAVMNHNVTDEWAWLFRLAVDKSYRQKGLGLFLTKAAMKWCRDSRFSYMELVITECQDDARQLFANAGFQVKQLYHKRLFTSAFTMQMFQLRCEIRPTFK